jgi:hypothetical protein
VQQHSRISEQLFSTTNFRNGQRPTALEMDGGRRMDKTELERRISERAFQIWIDEGQPNGRSKEHWEQAKAEVMARGLADQGEGLPPVDMKPD